MEVVTPQTVDLDKLALNVFLKSLEIAGGPRKLIEHRNLTWVPSLIQASYAVVLSEEGKKTANEIAQFLGLTLQTVRNILRASPELVQKRINQILSGEEMDTEAKTHTAGGLAKLAYDRIRQGDQVVHYLQEFYEQAAEVLGVVWPVEVLRRIKGVDFPASREVLAKHLTGLKIESKDITDILPQLPESVPNPSALLRFLKEAARA